MKYIIALLTLLALTGCGSTYDECKAEGYKGVVFYTDINSPKIHCSNGATIQEGKRILTVDGAYPVALKARYFPFKDFQ